MVRKCIRRECEHDHTDGSATACRGGCGTTSARVDVRAVGKGVRRVRELHLRGVPGASRRVTAGRAAQQRAGAAAGFCRTRLGDRAHDGARALARKGRHGGG
eukprot:7381678-Prymnesium_polylepis.1